MKSIPTVFHEVKLAVYGSEYAQLMDYLDFRKKCGWLESNGSFEWNQLG